MRRRGLLLLLALLLLASFTSQLRGEEEEAPKVEFSVVPNARFVQRSGEIPVVISVANQSAYALKLGEPRLFHPDFEFVDPVALPRTLSPFDEVTTQARIKAQERAIFGVQQLVARIQFEGSDGKTSFLSGTTGRFEVEVRRPWSDEASGLPGGNPALFFLLLPIIPAFFAYQLVDRQRRGEGWTVPKLEGESIAAAFFLALLVSLARTALGWAEAEDPTSLTTLKLLGTSFILGAAWPGIRWWSTHKEWKQWAFLEDDELVDYLEKALCGPRAPCQFIWTTAKVDQMDWQGLLLEQPDASRVLGACVQLSTKNPNDPLAAASGKRLEAAIGEGSPQGRRQAERKELIVELRKCSGGLKANLLQKAVLQGASPLAEPVIVARVAGLKRQIQTPEKIVTFVP